MLIKKFCLIWLLFASFSAVIHATTITQLQEKLSAHQIVRGQYTQIKNMQLFKQPLLSSGEFLIEQQQGLLWSQTKPFLITLALNKDKLSQRIADQPAQIMQASDNPMVFYFSHLFLSLFKGDTEGLSEQFVMELQSKGERWSLLLTPKSSPLDKIFQQITISGATYIETLQLNELQGDSTKINFINQHSYPPHLSKDERSSLQF
ncbi:outer membrane lipoprotein carrier protein LolA [Psychromonas sp. MME2]|uniref:outer membrane lipoprotein carrier protein LolA n=1 Tax=unclassified Psychromonas TaxID=2614957 RepID=UPI00339BFA0D